MRSVVHEAGFRLEVQPEWELLLDVGNGVALVSLEPPHEGFRASHVVMVDELPQATDLEEWQDGAETLMRDLLPSFRVIDRGRIGDDSRRLIARLAHHDVDGTAVTMYQLAGIVAGRGVTLTSSVATLDLPGLGPALNQVLSSFTVTSEVSE
jgi:hypothetical protein